MSQSYPLKKANSIHHADPLAIRTINDSIITAMPKDIDLVTVLCIGTDRSTGDSLGPMTGTLLRKMKPKLLNVHGTLSKPVHALNLDLILKEINDIQESSFIIAIDASLGKINSVGHFQSGAGSIQPGAALKKQLPAVGDAFITGVVNISGMMEYTVLQGTRLSLVYDMSHTLARTLFHLDLWLQKYHTNKQNKEIPLLKINSQ